MPSLALPFHALLLGIIDMRLNFIVAGCMRSARAAAECTVGGSKCREGEEESARARALALAAVGEAERVL